MTQYFSGANTTRRESLKDQIIVRSASSTPLLMQLPQVSVNHTVVEWSEDEPFQASESVRDISAPHAQTRREGADFAYREPHVPVRLRAIAQIDHEGMEISNTNRASLVAGMSTTFDYHAGQLFTKVMNRIDNTLMYGQGSPTTSGTTDERRTMGLIHSSAWTGLERVHGSKTSIEDPYGVTIPGSMFSVFYDANHSALTSSMFYNQIISRAIAAGSNFDGPAWTFHCGLTAIAQVARFLIADGGVPINERSVDAASGTGYDFMASIRLASGHVVNFRVNRWLHEPTSTYTVNNTDYTPGSPTTEGSINKTFSGDQTIIGWEPGTVRIGWYREPGFRKVETDGDYSRVACVAEYMLQVDAPLCVIGAGNILQ